MIKLFIDDVRFPDSSDWIIVRSSKEAILYLKENGMPDFISFDHDLGDDDTAIKVVDFIIEQVINKTLIFPASFSFFVHSANPIGKKNLQSKLNNFINFLKRDG